MKNVFKQALSFIMVAIMIVTVVSLAGLQLKASAANYNTSAAISYANSHWSDGIGLCAEFVSKCLAAGGVTIPNKSYYSSSTKSYNNIGGNLGAYTNPFIAAEALLLYLSDCGYQIISNPSDSQIDVGDVMFFYRIVNDSTTKDDHVGICIAKDSNGRVTYAAHNSATNSGRTSSTYPCTYVVKMNGSTESPTNAWVSLPNGPESSYLLSSDFYISFGAENATGYTIDIYRTTDSGSEHYWTDTVSSSSNTYNYSVRFDKTAHYSCVVTAINSAGRTSTEWIGWDVVDSAPSNAWVSLPNGPESSYLVNTEFKISFGAEWADTYHLYIWREYNGETSFHYNDYFYESPDSNNYCWAYFDKIGHYSCYILATNVCGETMSEWIGWDVVDSKPTDLSISTNKEKYNVGESIVFNLNAKYGYNKWIGIHKINGSSTSLAFESGVSGTSFSCSELAPGYYRANFDAMNVVGNTRSDWTYFSVGVYDVIFNANGGICSTSSKSVTYNSTYGELPIPTRTGYTFAGWYISASGGTQITADTSVSITSDQTLYAHWERDTFVEKIEISVDIADEFIFGKNLIGMTSTDLAGQFENSNINVSMQASRVATGTTVNLIDDENIVYDTLTVVIFGDVNGDGWYDGTDAMKVNLLANGMLTKDDVSEAEYLAADCNHDGVIDAHDVDILEYAGILLADVDQSKSEEELLETSSYVEYLNLIDQTIETAEDDTAETIVEDTPTAEDKEPVSINWFQMIVSFLKTLLNFVYGFFTL